jgi:hypothetical protein
MSAVNCNRVCIMERDFSRELSTRFDMGHSRPMPVDSKASSAGGARVISGRGWVRGWRGGPHHGQEDDRGLLASREIGVGGGMRHLEGMA